MDPRQRDGECDARLTPGSLAGHVHGEGGGELFRRFVYLTTTETRDYLRFPSTDAVLAWARRHRVPRCKRGHVVLFLRADLDAAVDPLRHGSTVRRMARSRPVHSPDRGGR